MSERDDPNTLGFIEVLFGFKVDRTRLLREQAVCVTCGGPGLHVHVIPPTTPTDDGENA